MENEHLSAEVWWGSLSFDERTRFRMMYYCNNQAINSKQKLEIYRDQHDDIRPSTPFSNLFNE